MSMKDVYLVHRNHFKDRYGEHITQDVFNDNVMHKVEDETNRDHYRTVALSTLAGIFGVLLLILGLSVIV